jgi:hypothetical protein
MIASDIACLDILMESQREQRLSYIKDVLLQYRQDGATRGFDHAALHKKHRFRKSWRAHDGTAHILPVRRSGEMESN